MDPHTDHLLDEQTQQRATTRRSWLVTAGIFALLAIMALVVLDAVGVVDAVGVDSDTVTAQSGSVTLTVEYGTVTRPGLATPFRVTVTEEGGFSSDTVDIAISAEYLTLWDFNAIIPAPQIESADHELVFWQFAAPEGEKFTMRLDARIEPARQSGAGARVAVLDADGDEVAAVDFTTNVRP